MEASREELISRVQDGYPFAEKYQKLENKLNRLKKTKRIGFFIYLTMFWVNSTFFYPISYGFFSFILYVQILGGFLWLPNVYGKIYYFAARMRKAIKVEQQMDEVLNEFTKKTSIFYEYCRVPILEKMEKFFLTARADTFKECYALVDTELHRDQVLHLKERQLDAQLEQNSLLSKQNDRLKSIESNTFHS
ncbi:hypothetical protein GKZ89_14040 [Bacillus mangrovi]|uniref:Uncharacterized protein n=1 Tax=Metabacillus mangrovi TaxID=1491830 RepID=A0A7X2S7B0_9BACI|nr:hypothetical protein [Metabacillus mangrovi]MTH54521.1 hypothetical protein [Metabacillus mangrovi]